MLHELFEQAGIVCRGGAMLPERERVFASLPYAISFGVPLPRTVVRSIIQAPTKLYFHHYRTINAYLDQTAQRIALHLQRQGYEAVYIPASQSVSADGFAGEISHKMVARLAGLGGIGMNGLFLSPEYGCGLRLSTILTDFPQEAAPIMKNPCRKCKKCMNACPSGAIFGVEWVQENPTAVMLDVEQCSRFMKDRYRNVGRGSVCGACIAACPLCAATGSTAL